MKTKVKSSDPNRVRFLTAWDTVSHFAPLNVRICNRAENDDGRFLILYRRGAAVENQCDNIVMIGGKKDQIADLVRCNLKVELASLAAFGIAWLCRDASHLDEVRECVWCERQRQRQLLRAKKFTLDVSHPTPDVRRKFRVLAEEIGEVAQAIDQLEQAGNVARPRCLANFDAERIQVVAVAIAWLESFEVQS